MDYWLQYSAAKRSLLPLLVVYGCFHVGVVSTFAGSGSGGWTDGVGTSARLMTPVGVSVDSSGTICVTENTGRRIRMITSDGEEVPGMC